ncbi:hypothetical protein ACIBHY_53900 [Nonomuraea sp. NPDC050547]|uniref:hypothetical protein n=1 Tax=Nonomuraea sp. NPDC050547 TaxID=3364368 RepID=UPI0037A35CA0
MREADDIEAAAAGLAVALQELCETYPTDDGPAVASLIVQLHDGPRHVVAVQPGQLSWLLRLVMDETATCSNAHADGNRMCAHCEGTGRVGWDR